jgi:hypothetical protein
MKKSLSVTKYFLPGLMAAFLLFENSCTKRHLEDRPTTGDVNITFDWKNLRTGETNPAGTKLVFYGNKGTVLNGTGSGTSYSGTLPIDVYKVVVYNSDATGVSYRNLDKYDLAEIDASSYTKASYISQPGHVYGVGAEDISVQGNKTVSRTVVPACFVKSALLKINILTNRQAVTSCSATLSGLFQSVNIVSGAPRNGSGMVELSPLVSSNGFESPLSFFAKDPAAPNIVSMTFNFTGGGSQTITVDITQYLSGTISNNININVDVDITGISGGSFQATLKDWNVTTPEVIAQ